MNGLVESGVSICPLPASAQQSLNSGEDCDVGRHMQQQRTDLALVMFNPGLAQLQTMRHIIISCEK